MLAMLRSTGADTSATFRAVDGTSHSVELLLSVDRDGPHTLGAQIEEQLRSAIRTGALRPGAQVPSTRDLARQLGISRRVAVEAYAQLAAEGYLSMRQGARPRVSDTAASPAPPHPRRCAAPPRRASTSARASPTSRAFPRTAWLRSLREALDDPHRRRARLRRPVRRRAAAHRARRLPRARARRRRRPRPGRRHQRLRPGAGPGLPARSPTHGAKRIAIEDPSNPEQHEIAAARGPRAGPGRRRRARHPGRRARTTSTR